MPLTRRKKLTLLCIGAAGVVVLCSAILALEDWLRERWYLWKLDTTEDPASRAQIIERLGRVGGEPSFRALNLREAEECPCPKSRAGLKQACVIGARRVCCDARLHCTRCADKIGRHEDTDR